MAGEPTLVEPALPEPTLVEPAPPEPAPAEPASELTQPGPASPAPPATAPESDAQASPEPPADEATTTDTTLAAAAGSAEAKAAIGHPDRTAASRRSADLATAGRAAAGTRPPSTTRPPATARPPAGPAEALRPPPATKTLPATKTEPATKIPPGTKTPPEPTPNPTPAGSSVFPEGFLPTLGPPATPTPPPTRTRVVEPAPPVPDDLLDDVAHLLAPPATRRYRKRRLAVVVLFLVLALVVLLVGQAMRDNKAASVTPAGTAPVRDPVPPDTVDKVPATASVAAKAGGFAFAGGTGPVLGSAGTLRRFRVAVEARVGADVGGGFADQVDRILGDSRSWIAGRQVRLQRVPAAASAEFTIYLASAGSSERMCANGGLRTGGFTSCRLPGQVIINSARWADAVPGYGAPVAVYRAYAINHEVGHQLGHGHEACPGKGEPAPVMMQQTYGLKGCVANAWPYLRGKRYAGNPVD